MAIPREIFEQPLGPRFRVHQASDWLGVDAPGYIVSYVGRDAAIWTGGFMPLADAAAKLFSHRRGDGGTKL